MILCLDVGNSQIYGGVFDRDQMKLGFRRNSKQGSSSDEIPSGGFTGKQCGSFDDS